MYLYYVTKDFFKYYFLSNKVLRDNNIVILGINNIYYYFDSFFYDNIDYKYHPGKSEYFIDDVIILDNNEFKTYKVDEHKRVYLPSFKLTHHFFNKEYYVYVTKRDLEKNNIELYDEIFYEKGKKLYSIFIEKIENTYSFYQTVNILYVIKNDNIKQFYQSSVIEEELFGLNVIKSNYNNKKLHIYGNITKIGSNSFVDLDIEEIIIESIYLTRVDSNAFVNLKKLKKVTLINAVLLHKNAFYKCNNLEIIISTYHNYYLVDEDLLNIKLFFLNDNIVEYNGYIYDNNNRLISVRNRSLKIITLNNEQKYIGPLAFANMKELEIFVSYNETNDALFIFHGCNKLEYIKMKKDINDLLYLFSDIYYEDAYLFDNFVVLDKNIFFNKKIYGPKNLKKFNNHSFIIKNDNLIALKDEESDEYVTLVYVKFESSEKEYLFKYELDDEVRKDDILLVESFDGEEVEVEVTKVLYLKKEDSPLPYEKLKKIKGRA